MAGLPGWLSGALQAKLENISRTDLRASAQRISERYRAGGGSDVIRAEFDGLAYAVVRMPPTHTDEGLKAALNDAAGGELATNLRGVYNYSISRLTRANIHNDAPMIQEVIDLIVPVYGAWKSIATPAGQAASS